MLPQISLGMTRAEVERLFGEPEAGPKSGTYLSDDLPGHYVIEYAVYFKPKPNESYRPGVYLARFVYHTVGQIDYLVDYTGPHTPFD